MKNVNVTFRFSKDCPYNLDGTCINQCDNLDCGIGKSEPPSQCPLQSVANSENAEQKITTHNNPNVSAIKDIIDSQVESVGTPNGVYINRQQVWDCLNFYETSHLG